MADNDKDAENVAPAGFLARASHAEARLGVKSCAWPIGDPGQPDFRFCEAPAVEGKPYCREHAEKAYTGRPKDDKVA